MKWKLEAWSPEYALPDAAEESESSVEVGLEGDWKPIQPGRSSWPVLYFVDGRMRIDERLVDQNGHRALLITVVAGALVRDDAGIKVAGEPWVRRILLHGPRFSAEPLRVEPGLVYQPLEVAAEAGMALNVQTTFVMRRLEAQLAAQLTGGVVILDGPFIGADQAPRQTALAYAKTMQKKYLPTENEALLLTLEPGQRTPMFQISKSVGHRLDLLSWYIKLPITPASPFHATAGLIRVELPMQELDRAKELADLSTDLFCSMASSPARDPRAPQNFIAIGGLEAMLGRYMGQSDVVRRKIFKALFLEA